MGETNEQQSPERPQQGTCRYGACNEPRWPESEKGYCIYHDPNNGHNEELAERVWEDARRRIKEGNCEFVGWHFPKDPLGLDFGEIFPVDEINTEINPMTFTSPADFTEAKFDGPVDFNEAIFQEDAIFDLVTFGDNADFSETDFEKDASFWETRFEGKARFLKAKVRGFACFQHATFRGEVTFFSAKFFEGASFRLATFKDRAIFLRVTFKNNAEFWGAMAQGEIHFDLPPKSPWAKRPFRHRRDGQIPYRLAKQSAHNRGAYEEESKYHYAERCAALRGRFKSCRRRLRTRRRKQQPHCRGLKAFLNATKNLLNTPIRPIRFLGCLLELIFARMIFGYGERPVRVLGIAALIILTWSILCFACAGIVVDGANPSPEGPGWWNSVYFSVVTFTTLGYGDFQPKPYFRPWAAAEAAIGAAMMALFIVSLARKYAR